MVNWTPKHEDVWWDRGRSSIILKDNSHIHEHATTMLRPRRVAGIHTQLNGAQVLSGSNISSATQDFSLILWNPKANCRVHNSPSFLPFRSQINEIYAVQFCFFKIHVNIIPHPRLFLPSGSFLKLSNGACINFSSPSTCHARPVSFSALLLPE